MSKNTSERNAYRTTYHRDGTVTVWDVHQQAWTRVRADRIGDAVLASLSDAERRRISRMAFKRA
jgi:hypothetical protein